MSTGSTRREFLTKVGAAAAVAIGDVAAPGCASEHVSAPRVSIARHETLRRSEPAGHVDLLSKLLNKALQKITDTADEPGAWRQLFRPGDRIGIKVNTLGLSTHPAVVDAIVRGLSQAGIPERDILIWDRFDTELSRAGFELNKRDRGVQCRGTDAAGYGSGYQDQVEISGSIGSCFSRIVAEEVTALICVPVLKDHNLAGVSLGMKNFYGAIHNPNKYHDHNCDPYVADVVSHRFIAPKWRLTVCDATRAQYHAGPGHNPGYSWSFGGLIVGTDFVATDAVAADLLEKHRRAKGLKSLSEEKRPPKHIATAAARGLGVADLTEIERYEV